MVSKEIIGNYIYNPNEQKVFVWKHRHFLEKKFLLKGSNGSKINFKEIYNIILNTKDIDKTTKDYLIKILTILGNELIKPKKEK